MITTCISSLEFYFAGHSPLISGPKMVENPKILSIMVVQGVENMMKVKVIHFQRGPDTSNDSYTDILKCGLFL